MSNIIALSDDLKKLFNYEDTENPVISLYLNVDAARDLKKDYISRLNSMIVEKKSEIEKDTNYSKRQKKELFELMDKIKGYVNEYNSSESTKTLLLYAGVGGIFKEIRLPVNIKSKIIIDPKPHIQSLRNLLQNTKKYAVLLIDKEKAQIFLVYFNEIQDYLGAFISEVPSKVKYRSQLSFKEKNILSRLEEKLHQFFKLINEKTLELFREGRFDNLILAGRKPVLSQFRNYLHSYLQQRLIGDILAEPDSPQSIITEKAKALIDEFEKRYKNELVDKLLDEYNPNGMGVLGVEGVISFLMLERIKTLIYDSDFITDGYLCELCGYISTKEVQSCPYCKGKIIYYNDINDEIIETALNKGCEIVSVNDNQRLVEAGSIGAVLRFRL